MVFHKVVKNKAYFKRYQTKFRRRREGKTDYYARKRLVVQAKNKYAAPKYRLVTRISNKYVLVQVVAATLNHDEVLASASSRELPSFGLTVGLNNYAAAYCTGLLAARRLLKVMGLDSAYEGTTEVDGEVNKPDYSFGARKFFVRELDDDRRPFRVNLDVGIHATTTGAKIFGAMKGASDGGLDIPHSEKRFPGYDAEGKSYDAGVHRDRIFGAHVANYMRELQEEEPERYNKQFSAYIKAGVDADSLEDLYASVHARIRADPTAAEKKEYVPDKKFKNRTKQSLEQRKGRIAQKKRARAIRLAAELAAQE